MNPAIPHCHLWFKTVALWLHLKLGNIHFWNLAGVGTVVSHRYADKLVWPSTLWNSEWLPWNIYHLLLHKTISKFALTLKRVPAYLNIAGLMHFSFPSSSVLADCDSVTVLCERTFFAKSCTFVMRDCHKRIKITSIWKSRHKLWPRTVGAGRIFLKFSWRQFFLGKVKDCQRVWNQIPFGVYPNIWDVRHSLQNFLPREKRTFLRDFSNCVMGCYKFLKQVFLCRNILNPNFKTF